MRKYLRPVLAQFILAALILLAFALRVYHLDHFSLYQDEALTPLRASYTISQILRNEIVIQGAVTHDTHPPFYFLIIHFSQLLFGSSDFAYRYPSALAGALLLPVLYQLGRSMVNRRVGMLAALLAAINPLQVWYGQEARMYTLLILLVTAASYVLWRALSARQLASRDLAQWFALYAVLAALAFLTHYTAVFLIAAQSLFWLWLLWQRGQKRLIIAGAILAVVLAAPFVPYTVPRLFTGAEANYTYVSPLIMLQDVVHGFGMGLTVDFSRILIRLLDVGVLLVLLAGITSGSRKRKLFLLAFLLAVVVGLALGSLLKPMYQGARHIIVGSPAFLLLLACGVHRAPNRAWRTVALLVLLAGPLISLNNLYGDPQYAKDDLRGLIAAIERRAGGRDMVVYNNAILLSFHWHYQQRSDLPATALPVYPYVAGDETEARLAALAQQYDRLWFVVDPPADGRDDHEVVPQWLSRNLRAIERIRVHSLTMRTSAVAYDTRAAALQALPEQAITLEDGLRQPGPDSQAPVLRGWRKGFVEPVDIPTLWFDLIWQSGGRMPDDLRLRLALRDKEGQMWAEANEPLQLTGSSSGGEALLLSLPYGLTLPAGMPPGDYELRLLPWRENTGEALGEWRDVGAVSVAPFDHWSLEPPLQLDTTVAAVFDDAVRLLGLSGAAPGVRPGNALPLTLFWQADRPLRLNDLSYDMEMIDGRGEVWLTKTGTPGPGWLAPGEWPLGAPLRQLIGINVPAETPPGTYRLRWRLTGDGIVMAGQPSWRPWASEWVTLGSIDVQPWPLEMTVPADARDVGATLGESIELASFEVEKTDLHPGEALQLTLYWRARERTQDNYWVFVHVVAPDGTIVAQADRIPVAWKRPTTGWRAGEVLTDEYVIWLPEHLPAEHYTVYAGLSEPESNLRPPVIMDGEQQPDGRVLLTTLVVQAR